MDKPNWIIALIENHRIFKLIAVLICICILSIFIYLAVSIIFYKEHHVLFGQDIDPPKVLSDTLKNKDIVTKPSVIFASGSSKTQIPTQRKQVQTSLRQSNKSGKNEAVITSGNNNTVVAGANNQLNQPVHVVKGDNKGINGDVSITNEKEFGPAEMNSFVDYVNKLYKDKPYAKKCFSLFTTTQTNGGKFASQIGEFLLKQGFKFNGGGATFTDGVMRGIDVDISSRDSCLRITVGVL